jgi:ABC-type transporter Mla MlaB component
MSFCRRGRLTTDTPLEKEPQLSRPSVLVIDGPIACSDVAVLCERVSVLLATGEVDSIVCDVGALARVDAVAVDALARLQLTARRLDCRIWLRGVSGELRELLAFVGLSEALPELLVGPQRQAEEREERGSVEERVEADDPSV